MTYRRQTLGHRQDIDGHEQLDLFALLEERLEPGACPASGTPPLHDPDRGQPYPCHACGRPVMIRTDHRIPRHQVPKDRLL